MSGGSVSFDRAASYYDETRATDEASMRTIVELLERDVHGRGPVLELGVGTGQVALPLADRGVPVIGIDLSVPMMDVLRAKPATHARSLPLVRGDVTRLPVADAALGGAYGRWVLHLIPDWIAVLREVDRVVMPGGLVAFEPGGFSGPFREIYLRYLEALGDVVVPAGLTPIDRDRALDEGFGSVGWTLRRAVPIHYERAVSLAEVFDDIPTKRWSWTWRVPDDDLVAATRQVRAWAQERFDGLDRVLPPEPTTFRVFERAA